MAHVTKKKNRMAPNETKFGFGFFSSRKSCSNHTKLVTSAFFVVFDQYEKAFEELAKV